MTLSVVTNASPRQTGTTNTGFTFTTPAGIADGDFFVIAIIRRATSAPTSVPAGPVLLYGQIANSPAIHIYGKVWHTGDATSYAFTWSSVTAIGYIITYHSSSGATIGQDGSGNSALTSGGSAISYPSLTPATSADVVLCVGGVAANLGSLSTPTSMTSEGGFIEVGTSTNSLTGIYADQILTSNAATGTRSSTQGTTGNSVGATVLVMETAAVDPMPLLPHPWHNPLLQQ